MGQQTQQGTDTVLFYQAASSLLQMEIQQHNHNEQVKLLPDHH
jgi:hypothetical protein